MKNRTLRIPILALIVGAALAVGLSACNADEAPDDGSGQSSEQVSSDQPVRTDDSADADDSVSADTVTTSNDGTDANGDDVQDLPDRDGESFVGLTRDEAAALAESDGRRWRVGREDGVYLPVTEDFVIGRVTFELESDRVTAANIEAPFEDTVDPSTPLDVEDEDTAAMLAAATTQLLTVDHSFGVGEPPPFSDVRVATKIGGRGGRPLSPLTLEALAAAVTDTGASIEFTDDPQAMIDELFDANVPGVAVLTIGTVSLENGRAQVDMGLWCGSLCGVDLTYEVVETDGVWTVTGPIGPIAVS